MSIVGTRSAVRQPCARGDHGAAAEHRGALQGWLRPDRMSDRCISDLQAWIYGQRDYCVHEVHEARNGRWTATALAAYQPRGVPGMVVRG